MVQVVLVGLGAGVAAALLFLSPVSGTAIAFPLFILSGLSIAIAGLAWTWMAAAIASAAGAIISFLTIGPDGAAVFLLLFGFPLTWTTRLAGLSRPSDPANATGPVEWYPIGRILFHIAIAISIGMILIGIVVRFNVDQLAPEMSDTLAQWFAGSPDTAPAPTAADMEPFVRFNLALLPFTATVIALVILVVDLWLGARVANYSGRLRRPHDRMWTVSLPNEAAIVFPLALLGAFLPGSIGEVSAVIAGAFAGAAALVGLAVLHAVTLGVNLRVLILVVAYVLLFLFGFPFIFFVLLGLGESIFHFRARRFSHAPPPPS